MTKDKYQIDYWKYDEETGDENKWPLTIFYEYNPPKLGRREPGTNLLLTPDEPASVNILSIQVNEKDVSIYIPGWSASDELFVEEAIYNHIHNPFTYHEE